MVTDEQRQLKQLVTYCEKTEYETFTSDERDTSDAVHIPYSGMGSNTQHMLIRDDVERCAKSYITDYLADYDDIDEAKQAFDYEGSDWMHEYIDGWLVWNLNLEEASKIIRVLSEHEETDTGLWEGCDQPEEAISTKAFFTFRNAVTEEVRDLLERAEDDELTD